MTNFLKCKFCRFNVYFYGFIMCEIFNVTVAVIVLFLTNKFLNHRFLFYGPKVKIKCMDIPVCTSRTFCIVTGAQFDKRSVQLLSRLVSELQFKLHYLKMCRVNQRLELQLQLRMYLKNSVAVGWFGWDLEPKENLSHLSTQ